MVFERTMVPERTMEAAVLPAKKQLRRQGKKQRVVGRQQLVTTLVARKQRRLLRN